jgi:hypothetical protein
MLAAALFVTLDLSVNDFVSASIPNGASVKVRFVSVDEQRDPTEQAVRSSTVRLEIDRKPIAVPCGNYELPRTFGKVQVDCTVTKGYYSNTTTNHWGLNKDARIRIWPKSSPWMPPGTFTYPLNQRWFLSHTQMSNEPTYVDRGERSTRKKVYYHAGLDSGGSEALTEVLAATDAQIVSLGTTKTPPSTSATMSSTCSTNAAGTTATAIFFPSTLH